MLAAPDRAALLALLLALAAALPAAAEATFEFEPAAPTSNDRVTVRATYTTDCFPIPQRAEVLPGVVRLLAAESCTCFAVPGQQGVEATVGPLAAGAHRVELVIVPDPADPDCDFEPRLEGSTELPVEEGPELLAVEPPAPTTADEVVVLLRSHCPIGLETPVRQGSTLLVPTIPSQSLAPCGEEPIYDAPLRFGRLPAGDYTVVLLFDDGFSGPVLVRTAAFTVHPAPDPALQLLADRFRATASWSLAGGRTGAAQARPLTADSGSFWFFGPANLELLVKIHDGCDVNGHYWFFAAGLTNVGVTLLVEDTATGQERVYGHAAGSPFAPVLDTRAFACP